jgi:hypothetical protein
MGYRGGTRRGGEATSCGASAGEESSSATNLYAETARSIPMAVSSAVLVAGVAIVSLVIGLTIGMVVGVVLGSRV